MQEKTKPKYKRELLSIFKHRMAGKSDIRQRTTVIGTGDEVSASVYFQNANRERHPKIKDRQNRSYSTVLF